MLASTPSREATSAAGRNLRLLGMVAGQRSRWCCDELNLGGVMQTPLQLDFAMWVAGDTINVR